jgi:uncharacterized membrane protein
VSTATPTRAKTDWWIPAGLLALGFIPVIAGTFRLFQLGGGMPLTPDNARFLAAPLPVALHIVFSVIYSVLGAFQFSPSILRRHPKWHRTVGKGLVFSGMVVALSGIWMTLIYPIAKPEGLAQFDGLSLYVIRLLVGAAMAAFIVLGYAAIRKRAIPQHRAWMLRSYALGLGAGTQVFTHIPMFVFPGIQGELARTLCMAAGWGINLALAEWVIARERRQRRA